MEGALSKKTREGERRATNWLIATHIAPFNCEKQRIPWL